jgi:cell fate regulator YaaT (PSP1 superfamily)
MSETPEIPEITKAPETTEVPETTEPKKAESKETSVIHVRFKTGNKTSVLEIQDIDVEIGTCVVAESDIGLSLGTIVKPKEIILKTREPLKHVLRVATEKDFQTDERNRLFENEAKNFCSSKAVERNLEMKVVSTESTLDRKKLIFYFTADNRVDFRELVRDLASKFKTRIEMRQIGVRDEVKLIGGIGICGQETCCSRFLTHFAPISIKMAKKQALSINQGKLSGLCGRLMCCLNYEIPDKDKRKPRAPRSSEGKGRGAVEPATGKSPETAIPANDDNAAAEERPKETPGTAEQGKPAGTPDQKPGKGRHGRGRGDKPSDDQKKQGRSSNKRRGFWKKKKQKTNTDKKPDAPNKPAVPKKPDAPK